MGFVPPIQSLNQLSWPEREIGRGRVASKSTAASPRVFSPGGVETPDDALAYIQQLYQDGRTEELVGLLRGNPLFREAWQTLQQSAASGSEAAGATPTPDPASPPAPSALPVPAPDQTTAALPQNPHPEMSGLQVAATQGFSPEIQASQNHLVPYFKPSRPLAAGRRVYENQALYFTQEKVNSHRINIRV